jgi:hypothetical protein
MYLVAETEVTTDVYSVDETVIKFPTVAASYLVCVGAKSEERIESVVLDTIYLKVLDDGPEKLETLLII